MTLTLKAYPFKTLATPGFVSYLVPAFSTRLRDAVACPKLDAASLYPLPLVTAVA